MKSKIFLSLVLTALCATFTACQSSDGKNTDSEPAIAAKPQPTDILALDFDTYKPDRYKKGKLPAGQWYTVEGVLDNLHYDEEKGHMVLSLV
ncbi:MAG: hypothetical protein AAF570_22565, partial [Bacteroidota bacterium]